MTEFLATFYLVLLCIIGIVIGSFLNVVIYRLPLMLYGNDIEEQPKISLSWPPSHCPVCKKNVLKRDNIPVLSWVLLHGKCRYCRTAISAQYPVVEALTGVIFLLLGLVYLPAYSEIQISLFAIMFSVLLCLSVIDIEQFLLPDPLVFLLLWSGLTASVLGYIPVQPRDAVLGVIAAWGLLSCLMVVYQKLRNVDGLGYGDIKLFSAASAWCGLQSLPELILVSAVLGVVAHLFFVRKAKVRAKMPEDLQIMGRAYFPFGPSIALATLLIFHLKVL